MRTGFKRGRSDAFSLIEVVVAVGVFAGTIVAVLGLLGPALQTSREVIDSSVAARLAEGVDQELGRAGYNFVSTSTAGAGEIHLYAISDGSYLAEESIVGNDPVTGNPKGIAAGNRYFRLIVTRLDEPVPPADDSFLALSIRAEWPFNSAAGNEADATERKWFSFNTSIRP